MSTARIALVQLPAYSIQQAAESLDHTLRRIDDAAAAGPDLIALPEGTYPAYILGDRALSRLRGLAPEEAIERIGERARRHGVWIAAGVAAPDGEGGYHNAAMLFARDGSVAGRYAKAFLWHFDARWFTPGSEYPVFETDFARIGILVCADGRLPEIARALTLGGAQILVDLTAWVSGGRRPADLTTVQREYLMPVRAAENGIWVVCADKYGVEAASVVYCGRSCVIDPGGRIVAELGPDEDAVLPYDVPVEDAAPPLPRHPELYGAISAPIRATRPGADDDRIALRQSERRVAAVQLAMPPDLDAFLPLVEHYVEQMSFQGADAVLFPAVPSRLRAAYPHDRMLAELRRIAEPSGLWLAFTVSEGTQAEGPRAMYLVGPAGQLASTRQTHKPDGPRFATMPLGDEPSPVVDTPFGRVGLMAAADGFVPEVARSLMLRGAEVLLWAADDPPRAMSQFVRARADENRVFVVAAAAASETGATMIVDPTGRVLAQALEGLDLAISANVNPAFARLKAMAPDTDVILNRRPDTYGLLTAPQPATARL